MSWNFNFFFYSTHFRKWTMKTHPKVLKLTWNLKAVSIKFKEKKMTKMKVSTTAERLWSHKHSDLAEITRVHNNIFRSRSTTMLSSESRKGLLTHTRKLFDDNLRRPANVIWAQFVPIDIYTLCIVGAVHMKVFVNVCIRWD